MNSDELAPGMRYPQQTQLQTERDSVRVRKGKKVEGALTGHTVGTPALAGLGVLLAKEVYVNQTLLVAMHLQCILELLVTCQWHVLGHLSAALVAASAAPLGTFSTVGVAIVQGFDCDKLNKRFMILLSLTNWLRKEQQQQQLNKTKEINTD